VNLPSKILEHIIHEKVTSSISDHISTSQYERLLALPFNDFWSSLNISMAQNPNWCYFKAFDWVPHNVPLLKLWQIGITGDLWWWFKSYLNNQFQSVWLNGSYSTLLPGVPQGSILVFSLYINDLFLSIHHSNALSFADDTKLFKLIFDLVDSLKLQEDLNSLAVWSHDYLAFNSKKFRHLSFLIINSLPSTRLMTHR